MAAAAMVVAIAVGINLGASAHQQTPKTLVVSGSIASVTLPAEAERVQPSEEQWTALLPRLEQAVAAAPSDINLKRKLALAYYNLGHFEEAAALYRELLDIKEDAVLRNRLGNTLRDMGNLAAAEEAYRQAIRDDPSLPRPYINLAELLWREGRDDEALALIEEGLAEVPQESRSLLEEAREVIMAQD